MEYQIDHHQNNIKETTNQNKQSMCSKGCTYCTGCAYANSY